MEVRLGDNTNSNTEVRIQHGKNVYIFHRMNPNVPNIMAHVEHGTFANIIANLISDDKYIVPTVLDYELSKKKEEIRAEEPVLKEEPIKQEEPSKGIFARFTSWLVGK